MKKYPKVLVVAHNPFSNMQNNGKTLASFFKGWPKDKIAQLYFTYDSVENDVCDNFYRITDLDILKNIIQKENVGCKHSQKDFSDLKQKENLHKNKLYIFIRNLFKKRYPLMYCIRNVCWNISKPWKMDEINNWIDEINPDIVFFQSSNVYTIFKFVKNICDSRKIPLIMETTDDYVTARFSISPFFWIDYLKMVKWYEKLVDYSECVFAIGDKMKEEYSKRFGGNYKVAMNCIDIAEKVKEYEPENGKKIKFLYAGNLGLNRWKTLEKVGKALDELKKENSIDCFFEIYSIEKPEKNIMKAINIEGTMRYMGKLSSEELLKKRNCSDVLVHVESFDKKNIYITRLSISTKIPEYLAAKRCILAIGPKEIASIKYIMDNNVGITITDMNKKNMKEKLLQIITNQKLRLEYSKRTQNLLKERHDSEKNKNNVQGEIMRAV